MISHPCVGRSIYNNFSGCITLYIPDWCFRLTNLAVYIIRVPHIVRLHFFNNLFGTDHIRSSISYISYGNYNCRYRTLSAETVYLYNQSDTVVTDTVFVFQGENVFPSPPDLDYFLSLDAYIYITPVCGPIETGDSGNVTGDGEGFFTGLGPSRSIHIVYTMPRTVTDEAYETK